MQQRVPACVDMLCILHHQKGHSTQAMCRNQCAGWCVLHAQINTVFSCLLWFHTKDSARRMYLLNTVLLGKEWCCREEANLPMSMSNPVQQHAYTHLAYSHECWRGCKHGSKTQEKKRRCWERFPRDCHIYWTVSLLNYHVYERGMSASRYRCWNSRCSHIGWLATFNGQLYTWVFTVQTVVEKWMHCGYTLWCWSDLLEVNERTHSDRGCW